MKKIRVRKHRRRGTKGVKRHTRRKRKLVGYRYSVPFMETELRADWEKNVRIEQETISGEDYLVAYIPTKSGDEIRLEPAPICNWSYLDFEDATIRYMKKTIKPIYR